MADFKGKKIRIFASDFQSEALKRLGRDAGRDDAGDVLPALQQGAIDGAIAGITVFSAFHYQDAAKYVTEVNQPSIFLMIEISKTWYESLPPDLQKIIDKDAAAETVAINPAALALFNRARETWTAERWRTDRSVGGGSGEVHADHRHRRRGRVKAQTCAP